MRDQNAVEQGGFLGLCVVTTDDHHLFHCRVDTVGGGAMVTPGGQARLSEIRWIFEDAERQHIWPIFFPLGSLDELGALVNEWWMIRRELDASPARPLATGRGESRVVRRADGSGERRPGTE